MKPDQIIALIASLGTWAAAVATFLTVRQIRKQSEASYRPELTFTRTMFEGVPLNTLVNSPPQMSALYKNPSPSVWLKTGDEHTGDKYGGDKANLPRFTVPLRNVGLGAAKNITVSWSVPMDELGKQLEELGAQHKLSSPCFKCKHNSFQIVAESLGQIWFSWRNEATIDYLVPVATQPEPYMVELPNGYVQAVSMLIFLFFTSPEETAKKTRSFDIPVLKVDFEYFDIGDHKHHTSFNIEIIASGIFPNEDGVCHFFGAVEFKNPS
jgi:hypothetical protein